MEQRQPCKRLCWNALQLPSHASLKRAGRGCSWFSGQQLSSLKAAVYPLFLPLNSSKDAAELALFNLYASLNPHVEELAMGRDGLCTGWLAGRGEFATGSRRKTGERKIEDIPWARVM